MTGYKARGFKRAPLSKGTKGKSEEHDINGNGSMLKSHSPLFFKGSVHLRLIFTFWIYAVRLNRPLVLFGDFSNSGFHQCVVAIIRRSPPDLQFILYYKESSMGTKTFLLDLKGREFQLEDLIAKVLHKFKS